MEIQKDYAELFELFNEHRRKGTEGERLKDFGDSFWGLRETGQPARARLVVLPKFDGSNRVENDLSFSGVEMNVEQDEARR